ncbi:MAG: cation diffusion facilitator family transporter [Microthrixaceae bacterium]|nr:cation diffusion facilitator family transporter [Microthrixaceae bacterium]
MAHDHGAHTHSHGSALARSGEAAKRPLSMALAITLVTLVVQVAVGLYTGSLSLLADGAHLLTDAGGIALALAAVTLASRPTRSERTFGLYRLEVLSALANGLLLLAVALWAFTEAVSRIQDPPDVPGLPVLVVGAVGLVANLVALRLLGGGGSLAAEGARLEVLADAVGSVGVVVGGALILATDQPVMDAWIGLAIAVWIVPRSLRLVWASLRILLQEAPARLDLGAVQATLEGVPGVLDVHDLHVWTLTTDMDVLTAHLMVGPTVDQHEVLDRARDALVEVHRIHHATLQVEPDTHSGCEQVDW